jgi:subtilase family serine protease
MHFLRLGPKVMSLCAVATVLIPVGSAARVADAIPLVQPNVKATHIKVQPFGVSTAVATDWTPQTLAAAYGVAWSRTLGAGKTIAIIDAYDSPTVEADLATFSQHFGIPECTTANGCFKRVNQVGTASPLPAFNADWAMEINLDVQWAHALAPGAKILLVEARTSNFDDLNAAEAYANNVSDATYISNSWGAPEFLGQAAFDSIFTPVPGKSMLFASGDTGLPASYPSAAPNVVSVGGTTISTDGSTVTEAVWTGGGGGCSKYALAPAAQLAFTQYQQAGCKKDKRSTPDIAAIADPATGVLVYSTRGWNAATGWFKVGGTSLATPVVAAIAAGAGITLNASTIYGTGFQFRDANKSTVKKAKTNGAKCKTGFDMCTGRGTLIGITAFGRGRWR